MKYCLHETPGRLRIKIPGLQGNSQAVEAVREELMDLAGVWEVNANALTGSSGRGGAGPGSIPGRPGSRPKCPAHSGRCRRCKRPGRRRRIEATFSLERAFDRLFSFYADLKAGRSLDPWLAP